MNEKPIAGIVLAGCLALAHAQTAAAGPGGLDTSFGGGRIRVGFGFADDFAHAVAVQPDGKVVVAGSSTTTYVFGEHVALVRYGTNNLLDPTFGDGGKVISSVSTATNNSAVALAVKLQSDGKIVVAGSFYDGTVENALLMRYNGDGSLDNSFGQGGVVTNHFLQGGRANAVAIQPDGKLVIAGIAFINANSDFAISRYTTNGQPDLSFGGTGTVLDQANGDAEATGILLQADGKIIATGDGGFDFAALRYTTNGTLDTSFNGTGKVTIDFDQGLNQATAVQIQPDGKMIVAGYAVIGGTAVDMTAVRLRTNGLVDSSFGIFGELATQIGSPGCLGTALAIQPDGNFLIAGYSANGSDINFAVTRYTTNGFLDNSFNGNGIVTTPIGLTEDLAMAMAIQSDGKIIVAGAATIVGHPEFVAVRYQTNGALDTSYGVQGKAFVDFEDNADNTLNALALDGSGRAVVAGDAGGSFGIARLQADPVLKIMSLSRLTNGHVILGGVGVPNRQHTVQGTDTLNPGVFVTIGSATADDTGRWQYEDSAAAGSSQRFYRLSVP